MSLIRRAAVSAVALLVALAAPATAAPTTFATGLEPYFDQQVVWGPCAEFARTDVARDTFADPRFDCAYLDVPLDYGDPNGEGARIAMLRQKALDPSARIGSLFTDPGGPGGSGVTFLPALARLIGDGEVAQRFDLIGFDPRGVGVSEPAIDCSTDAEVDAERADLDLDTSPEGVARTEAEHRDLAQRCLDRNGADVLANVGTRDVARDLRLAHQVLGDEQLSYVGYSYGTAIGAEFAEQFPTGVRAMVLDGAVDPALDPIPARTTQARGFQRAFDNFAGFCAAQPECPLGTDVPGASPRVQELLKPLIDAPAPAGPDTSAPAGPDTSAPAGPDTSAPAGPEGRVLGYNDGVTGLLQGLYSEALWPRLVDGLTGLAAGDGTTLLRLADIYYDRAPDGSYGNLLEAFPAIGCVDEAPVTDRGTAREISRINLELAPFLDAGSGPSDALDLCAFWPVPPTSEAGPAQAPGLPTVLVASSTGDPATPYEDGVSLAAQLAARLLTVENDGHTVVLQGTNTCADELTTRYLVDLALPAADVTCPADG